jgi:hypothetical protein
VGDLVNFDAIGEKHIEEHHRQVQANSLSFRDVRNEGDEEGDDESDKSSQSDGDTSNNTSNNFLNDGRSKFWQTDRFEDSERFSLKNRYISHGDLARQHLFGPDIMLMNAPRKSPQPSHVGSEAGVEHRSVEHRSSGAFRRILREFTENLEGIYVEFKKVVGDSLPNFSRILDGFLYVLAVGSCKK